MIKSKKTFVILGIGACAALALAISCATVDRVVVAPPMIPGAKYVGTDTCASCHEKEVQNFKLTQHSRIRTRALADQAAETEVDQIGCESCHGPGSLHVDAGGGKGVFIVNSGKNPDACFQCHMDKSAEFSLPFHHPVKEGKMSCNDCHDPHGDDIHNPKGMFVARVNATCAKCHREQTRPHVFEHEATREGCTSCHAVHGSINDKMLTERDNNLCLKCHGEIAAGAVQIGARNHNSFIGRGTCFSAGCHTGVHGSDINPHLRY